MSWYSPLLYRRLMASRTSLWRSGVPGSKGTRRFRSARATGCKGGSKRTASIGRPSYSFGTARSSDFKLGRQAKRKQPNMQRPTKSPMAIAEAFVASRQPKYSNLPIEPEPTATAPSFSRISPVGLARPPSVRTALGIAPYVRPSRRFLWRSTLEIGCGQRRNHGKERTFLLFARVGRRSRDRNAFRAEVGSGNARDHQEQGGRRHGVHQAARLRIQGYCGRVGR